jgi:hypothetical protein
MSTKAQARLEAMEVERQVLGSIAQLNDGLRTLSTIVEGDGQNFGARIQRLEHRLAGFERIAQSLSRVLGQIERDNDRGNWWRDGNGRQP